MCRHFAQPCFIAGKMPTFEASVSLLGFEPRFSRAILSQSFADDRATVDTSKAAERNQDRKRFTPSITSSRDRENTVGFRAISMAMQNQMESQTGKSKKLGQQTRAYRFVGGRRRSLRGVGGVREARTLRDSALLV
jgi:hypothetical protein